MGGKDAAMAKVNSFCHPEVYDTINRMFEGNMCFEEGYHVDGTKQQAVDVDNTWPKWIVQGNAPAVWFRPR